MSKPESTRVLVVLPFAPFAERSGSTIRSGEIVKALAGEHRVSLAVIGPEDKTAVMSLSQVVEDFTFIEPRRASVAQRVLARLPGPIHRPPHTVDAAAKASLARYVAERSPDVVVCWGAQATAYLDLGARKDGVKYVLDEVGTDHLRLETYLATESSAARRLKLCWSYWRTKRSELWMCSRADKVFAASPSEAAYLNQRVEGQKAVWLPGAPNPELSEHTFHEGGDGNLLFCGGLWYPPNADAVEHFINDVLPSVTARHPKVSMTVVGKAPAGGLETWKARYPHVTFAGYVDDLAAEFRRADIFVSPLRQGRGYPSKLLDALSSGPAVVSYDLMDATLPGTTPGIELLLASNSEEFAAAVCRLLDDPGRRREQSRLGREYAATMTWEKTLRPLLRYVEDSCEPSS